MGEFLVVFHLTGKLRLHRQVAEVIHRFAHQAATMLRVSSHFGHDEIRLAQGGSLGINADKNLGHLVNIQGVVQFDDTNLPV